METNLLDDAECGQQQTQNNGHEPVNLVKLGLVALGYTEHLFTVLSKKLAIRIKWLTRDTYVKISLSIVSAKLVIGVTQKLFRSFV